MLAPHRFAALALSLLSVGALACDKSTPETTSPAAAPDPSTEVASEEALPPDANFECRVDPSALSPWTAEDVDLTGPILDDFRLWGEMDSDVVPPVLADNCDNPPSGGEYSPVKGENQGGIASADVLVVVEPVTIYRAFTAESSTTECLTDSPAGPIGSWWSLSKPSGDKRAYADAVGICPAWNDLSMVMTCTLAAGSVVLVGPTQSASCAGTSSCEPPPEGWSEDLPATRSPQLFITTYKDGEPRSEEDLGSFLDCEAPQAWAE
ncbi:hypothetical protein PPSIR1_18957 [Plesiocystis pacifica SIR-1]|uniref:Uncharacterized protein n=1 Tax=Plesiocystis pacifica SIR-1 TaxID=391625 RepID=A6GGK8_9BACT|nr:hypothetical protein [Plesiocystis pacifica]EDM74968.1 hypothetical protein PPSIR1_18957 [Plesiocystis pacifica SIR-1]